MSNSTDWSGVTINSTNYSGSYYIPNLGVIMNDTVYLMNDTVATINDEKINPIYGASTNWADPS